MDKDVEEGKLQVRAGEKGAYKRPRNGMLGRRWGEAQREGILGMPGEVRDVSRRVRRWGGGRPGAGPREARAESQRTREGPGGPREGLAVGGKECCG